MQRACLSKGVVEHGSATLWIALKSVPSSNSHICPQFDQPVELAIGAELTRNKGAKGEAVGKQTDSCAAAGLLVRL